MTAGSETALSGQLLLIDSDADCARRVGETLSEALLVSPEVSIAESGRLRTTDMNAEELAIRAQDMAERALALALEARAAAALPARAVNRLMKTRRSRGAWVYSS